MTATTKVALVTGANKGLGLEIARQLGKEGITVVLGARDEARGKAAADSLKAEGIDAHAVKLEVTNADDIAALPAYLESNFGRLDILVNNAGVNFDREGVTVETFRKTFEANVFAPYLLTEALLPLLKQSPAGRIVNHSSGLGSLTLVSDPEKIPDMFLGMPAYNSSKAALNMLTIMHSRLLKDTNIKVNAAHPGWVKTDMGSEEAPMEVGEGAKTAVRLAMLPEDGPTGGFFHFEDVLPW